MMMMMSTNLEDLSSVDLINDVDIECRRISDKTSQRHHIRVGKEFHLSVKSIRDLIENKLDIPKVCQVNLFMEGFSLDPLPPDFTNFPNRLVRRGEPLQISLSYYVLSAKLPPIKLAVEKFLDANPEDYDLISSSLNELNRNIFSVRWPSDEAVGTRLYLNSIGFLHKLHFLLGNLTSKLKQGFFYFQQVPAAISFFAEDFVPIFGSLTAAIRTLLTVSARWEDKMLLCEMKFPILIREIITVGELYFSSKNFPLMKKLGKIMIDFCFKELQLLLSVVTVSIQFGSEIEFLRILKDSIIHAKTFDHSSNVICLFNLAATSSVSQHLFSSGIYSEIVQFLSGICRIHQYNDMVSELCYRMILVTMHMLKTPGLLTCSDLIVVNSSNIINKFISNVKSEEIADLERGGFCFGTLENYFSILYVPSSSIVGRIIANGGSKMSIKSLIHNYYEMCIFMMEVLMLQDAGKRVILAENLLPHLIIADWKIPNLMPKVKKHFPSLTHFPFPTLYDIVAIKAVSLGFGDYKEMMHYIF